MRGANTPKTLVYFRNLTDHVEETDNFRLCQIIGLKFLYRQYVEIEKYIRSGQFRILSLFDTKNRLSIY